MSRHLPSLYSFGELWRSLRQQKRKPDHDPPENHVNKKTKRELKPVSLDDFPPEMQKKITDLATEALASIYYDINYVCILRSSVRLELKAELVAHYRLQFRESASLLDRTVGHVLDPAIYHSDPRGLLRRLNGFVEEFGWKMLSICMLAEGFRRACREFRHVVLWNELLQKIKENQRSLEVFARSRDLDWRGQLIKYANIGVPKLDAELQPARTMSEQHPHHIVHSINNTIRRPWFEGQPQIHISEPILDPEKWDEDEPKDPTLRTPSDGECNICRSAEICDCELDFSAGCLVELVERPITGTGVRALTFFKKGDMLGQFIGEICPPEWDDDYVYALSHSTKAEPEDDIATISPRYYGNWTRYIAHSCHSSTEFASRTIGKRTIMTVEAARDIAAFEDITVNYGPGYWADQKCMCGEANCISTKRKQP
ncbi:hypothetical protein BJX99DRAFT_269631 [Aspergillus californicus]